MLVVDYPINIVWFYHFDYPHKSRDSTVLWFLYQDSLSNDLTDLSREVVVALFVTDVFYEACTPYKLHAL